jgi:hypothetical protein
VRSWECGGWGVGIDRNEEWSIGVGFGTVCECYRCGAEG